LIKRTKPGGIQARTGATRRMIFFNRFPCRPPTDLLQTYYCKTGYGKPILGRCHPFFIPVLFQRAAVQEWVLIEDRFSQKAAGSF
jgi:hypothetical protein